MRTNTATKPCGAAKSSRNFSLYFTQTLKTRSGGRSQWSLSASGCLFPVRTLTAGGEAVKATPYRPTHTQHGANGEAGGAGHTEAACWTTFPHLELHLCGINSHYSEN